MPKVRTAPEQAVAGLLDSNRIHYEPSGGVASGCTLGTTSRNTTRAGLSVRSRNCLRRADTRAIGDLAALHEADLTKVRDLGAGGVREIVDALAKCDLHLRDGAASQRERNVTPTAGRERASTDSVLADGVGVLSLGVRASNCLRSIGVRTVRELVKLSREDLAKTPNLGKGTLNEVVGRLREYGLSLEMDEQSGTESGEDRTYHRQADPPVVTWDDPVTVFGLGVRASNCLRTAGIRTIRDLVGRREDDLTEIRNLGEGTLREIVRALAKHGLRLGTEVASPPAHPPQPTAATKPDRDGTRVTLSDDVGALNLGVRASNCLRAIGVRTVHELVALRSSDLARTRNLGRHTLAEIRERLKEHDLSLGMETRSIASSLQMARIVEVPVLDRSLGSLELGTRADNCLRSAGVRTVRDLVAFDRRQLLDLPHMGTGTLQQIVAVLAALGLELRNPREDAAKRRESFWRTLRAGLETVDAELKYIVSELVPLRYRNVVMLRLGWSGQPAVTLNEVAATPALSCLGHEVTRERIRQIESKERDAIRVGLDGLCPRRCSDALRLVSESSPVAADDIATLLKKHGLSRSGVGHSALCTVAELTGTAWRLAPLTNGANPVLVSTEKHVDYAAAVDALVAARDLPFGRVSEVAGGASQPSRMATLLTHLVEAHPEYRWLDRDAGLFWNAAHDGNKILFQCKKVFSLADCVHVDELRTGVQRTRTVTTMPPRHALIEMLRQTDWFEVHEDYVQRRDGISFDALSSEDRRLVWAAKGMGHVVRFSEIRDNLVREGVSSVQAGQNLLFSPFLFRVARGRYRLLFDAEGAAADAVRAADEAGPCAADGTDQSSSPDGGWATVVRMSSRAMITDRFPMDADVPEGAWDVSDGEDDVGCCTVGGGVVRRLAAILRRRGGNVGDDCRLTFDFDSRRLEIEILSGDQRSDAT